MTCRPAIRAYASYDKDRLEAGVDPFSQIGKGYFAILIDQGSGTTPLLPGHHAAGRWLAVVLRRGVFRPVRTAADPVPARLRPEPRGGQTRKLARRGRDAAAHAQGLAADGRRRVGRGRAARRPPTCWTRTRARNWSRANFLLDTAEAMELVGPRVGPTDLLLRLFHEEGPRVYDALPVQFGCTCSAERVRSTNVDLFGARHRAHDHRGWAPSPPIASSAARITSSTRAPWGSRLKPDRRRAMARPIDLDRLVAALEKVPQRPSSDYDLNADVVLPEGRVLRPAAVLIGVCEDAVILTKRASHLKHHPGQIGAAGRQDRRERCRTRSPPRCARRARKSASPRPASQCWPNCPATRR